MTDGSINDMNRVRSLIISASILPMSIIIGIGNADFTDMKILDSDKRVL